MKCPLLSLLLLLISALGTNPVPAQAQSFTFTIQPRPGMVPAARVRVTMELASPPVAAPSVTIGGTTATRGGGWVCLPGTGTAACPDASNDRFRLDPTGALLNGVSLLFEMRSHFNGANYCELRPGAPLLPRHVAGTFNGPGIVRHAIVTYTVAGATAATTHFCGQTQRRVNTSPALLSTPPPGSSALSRHPIDVILVLDKSGSMGWGLPGSPWSSSPRRSEVLNTALDQFFNLWMQTSEGDVHGDRIGVIHFDTNANPTTETGGDFFRPRGTNPVGPMHNWNQVLTAAKAPTPSGTTAIGKGLNLALQRWIANPQNFDAAIVLMTDGEQNVPPEVIKLSSADEWALDDPADGDPPVPLYLRRLPIHTIGFGAPGAVEAQLLAGVARQTGAGSSLATTALGLTDAMKDALLRTLKGNTLGLLAREQGSVSPATQVGTPTRLQVDASVRRVTFVLGWPDSRHSLDLVVRPVGVSDTVAPPVIQARGTNWTVLSYDIPTSGSIGEWTATVRGRGLNTPASYDLSAYSVDARLSYELHANPQRVGTGDALLLAVEIGHDGQPLRNIPGGVRLRLARPEEGLGNILHSTTVRPDSPSGPDAPSPYNTKVLTLAADGDLLTLVEPQPRGTEIVLRDDGTGGDESANDGVYTATISDTRTPGRYRFDVVLEWNDPRTGMIHRIESIEREVHVIPHPQNTLVQVSDPARDGSMTVSITPRDRFGNFMGPGYDDRVSVVVSGGTITDAVADPAVTGVYQVRVGNVPPGTIPTVTIDVDGIIVRTAMPLVPGVPGAIVGGRFALWAALGLTLPHGDLSNTHDGDLGGNLGLEFRLTPTTWIGATAGLHRFSGMTGVEDLDVIQVAATGKQYLATGAFRPFVTATAGAYLFDPGSTEFGASGGAGVQLGLTPRLSIDGRYTFHWITATNGNVTYSLPQAGLRLAF